ncbi:hypothetical protein ABMA74_11770 [Halobacteriovorax sp. HFRX-1_3]|uniref:hypothetical protein n=2 Tax=unclassified Halobacteriovorax TaxID=2639665 RepID=UPI00371001EE
MISKYFNLIPFAENDLDLKASAEIKVIDGHVNFHFCLQGDLSPIYIQRDNGKMNRVIGLWTQTCFEFFILNKTDGEYFEFNFGSDSSWNCFIFNSYRSELTEYSDINIDNIVINSEDELFTLNCRFELKKLGHNFEDLSNLRVSPTCVLTAEGDKTYYYSNKHPDNSPNFHHPDSFEDLIS